VDDGWPIVLRRRVFDAADQRWFAEATGDHNPLHADALLARRLLFGAPVVHGIHGLLWAMEAFLAVHRAGVARVAARFVKPIGLDEPVEAVLVDLDEERAKLRIEHDGTALASIRLDLHGERPQVPGAPEEDRSLEFLRVPRPLEFHELEGLAGTLEIPAGDQRLAQAFPDVAAAIGCPALAEFGVLSRLVGMECPGLHSLFAGLEVTLDPSGDGDELEWHVSRTDARVHGVHVTVAGARLRGAIDAFMRPRPVSQLSARDAAAVVADGEFRAVRALVVGGSRGLGEVTAKLIAAGGGTVVVTWHRGRGDADLVIDDIRSAGGRARALQLDIRAPDEAIETMAAAGSAPTHLFYFASPKISAGRRRPFDTDLFVEFTRYYVTGFARTVASLRTLDDGHLVAFYPSSVMVGEDGHDLVEYAAAKAAGETAARLLTARVPRLRLVVDRLPRLPTDQTVTLLGDTTEDAVGALLDALRRTVQAASPDPTRAASERTPLGSPRTQEHVPVVER
jgi:acyl dehydratase/NAD(P)-dependent dehydrogenase (short-subunit alcohol dehydrogenase family)